MTDREPATSLQQPARTEVGSVFVSNYPAYSFWSKDSVDQARQVLASPADPATPLGLYLHIPFCRKRCKFCYFKVYTDKNSKQIKGYLDALAAEVELYAAAPAAAGRRLRFVYFGGGTPSFISARHLKELTERVKAALPWDAVDEVTFECEPGTLTESKLEAIREIGVTRLSLGVENFDDTILSENGRAHVSKEIYRVLPWIAAQGFDQLNIDLIAGMVGESFDSWRVSVQKAIDLGPDSVTTYQMELPYNTVYSRKILDGEAGVGVADWKTKRAWNEYAIDALSAAGYEVSSAYTMVKSGKPVRFAYRDSLWRGSDLFGAGVASFSHVGGAHYQNVTSWADYETTVATGELPLERAFITGEDERLVRETILQLKLGRLDAGYFRDKFGVELVERFAPALERLAAKGMLEYDESGVRLSRAGLLQVDMLLPEFYAERYRNARYT